MHTFFLTCAILGGTVLALQLLLGVVGLDHHDTFDHHASLGGASEGLNLRSIRALSAGLAFFGVGGLAGLSTPFGWLAAIPLAIVAGLGAMVVVAKVMQQFGRFERDATIRIDDAIGMTAVVYLTVPGTRTGTRTGAGKIHVVLGGRTCEFQAVTDGSTLVTGTPVLIINVVNTDTVSVVLDPTAEPALSGTRPTPQLSSSAHDSHDSSEPSSSPLS